MLKFFAIHSVSGQLRYFYKDIVVIVLQGMILAFISLSLTLFLWHVFQMMNGISYYEGGKFLLMAFFSLLGYHFFFYLHMLHIRILKSKVILTILPNVWRHIFSLPLNSHKKCLSANVGQRLIDYEAAISAVLSLSLSIFLGGLVSVFLWAYIAYCNVFIASSYIVMFLLILAVKFLLLPGQVRNIFSQFILETKLAQLLSETFLHISKVRSSDMETIIVKKCEIILTRIKTCIMKAEKLKIRIWLFESLAPLGLLALLYLTFYFWPRKIDDRAILRIMVCTTQLIRIFKNLSTEVTELRKVLINFKRIQPVLNVATEKNLDKVDNLVLKGEIAFSDVCLQDENCSPARLMHITFKVRPGEMVAFVGPSGAGKSSIFNLLLGLEPVSAGTIMLDNKDIHSLNMQEIRQQFGVAPQAGHLLPGTIFSNIAMQSKLSLQEAWQLAERVDLAKEIERMPMKMLTYVSDELLSGGQKQKILIARALAKKPKILLLDEATSALDNQSQAAIYAYLKTLNITQLVIAHRDSAVMGADSMYIIDSGRCNAFHLPTRG